MLRVGLTGGIGSGKSTAATRLRELGAVVIDADAVAREIVEPGMPSLSAIARRFGPQVLTPSGALDRAALAAIVFPDPAALADLEAITHPAIWARTAELFAAVPPAGIGVHDMPLLVEKQMTGEYHLVLAVLTAEDVRIDRLTRHRGIPAADARARIAAQADDAARRAAADVLLDNNGHPQALVAAIDTLWRERLVPFETNVRTRTRTRLAAPALSAPDPSWPAQAERLRARVRHALGAPDLDVDHIGSTAVAGLPAKDVIDLQLGVAALSDADDPQFVRALEDAGFPRDHRIHADNGKDGQPWPKRFHGSADPHRIVHLHIREVASPGWRWARAFRDWLRADPDARADYLRMKREVAARHTTTAAYAQAKEPWFDAADSRLRAWLEGQRP